MKNELSKVCIICRFHIPDFVVIANLHRLKEIFVKLKLMKKLIACFLLMAGFAYAGAPVDLILSKGQQPQISTDSKGVIRIAFGRKDSIFCAASADNGKSFAKAVLVAVVPGMHLGRARGPQLASSTNYSVITAIDKKGDIYCFTLNHLTHQGWKRKGFVNDIRLSAPEGLMSIAADKQDNFYAVWLDTRIGKTNNIYFSFLNAKNGKWQKNTLAYQSPDGHVCECCRPGIAVQGSNVAIMFRNWLAGSRDLYLVGSSNQGSTFNAAQKLGTGTWKLNACPMDGGGLTFNADHSVGTTWRRQGNTYYSKLGENEVDLGNGKDCTMSSIGNQPVVAMSDNGTLKLKYVGTNKEVIVGKGTYLRTIVLSDNEVVCVWDEGDIIKVKRI